MNATKVKTIIKELPVKLTGEEILERAQRAAHSQQQLEQAEAEKRQANAGFKERIEEFGGQVRRLSEIVRTGVEFRETECEVRYYRSIGEVCVVRMDTDTVIDSRPMTWEEKQGILPL